MSSIYHFFKDLLEKADKFQKVGNLEEFPYKSSLLSCQNKGKFPDLAIKLNDDKIFTGGELIELKDSNNYNISSFNSTIPTGKKAILSIIGTGESKIKEQMEQAGDDINALKIRDVYYLVRGRRNDCQKIVLVHGDFFETVAVDKLIGQSFSQVLEESINNTDEEISEEQKALLSTVFSKQEPFSKVRTVDNASVKLRFRVMTEVRSESNLLNEKQYPDILDNTINFIIPLHSESEEEEILKKSERVFTDEQMQSLKTFKIKHHFNGYFFVFQHKLQFSIISAR